MGAGVGKLSVLARGAARLGERGGGEASGRADGRTQHVCACSAVAWCPSTCCPTALTWSITPAAARAARGTRAQAAPAAEAPPPTNSRAPTGAAPEPPRAEAPAPSALMSTWSSGVGSSSLQTVRPVYKWMASIPSLRCATMTFGGSACACVCWGSAEAAALSPAAPTTFPIAFCTCGRERDGRGWDNHRAGAPPSRCSRRAQAQAAGLLLTLSGAWPSAFGRTAFALSSAACACAPRCLCFRKCASANRVSPRSVHRCGSTSSTLSLYSLHDASPKCRPASDAASSCAAAAGRGASAAAARRRAGWRRGLGRGEEVGGG